MSQNPNYGPEDHQRAFELYRDCGSLFQVSESTGIGYKAIKNWSGPSRKCTCPYHDWDTKLLLDQDNTDQAVYMVLGPWKLEDLEEKIAKTDLPAFRTWLRIFAISIFFTTGDVPAVLRRDVNGEPLTAAELKQRTQTLRKPSYKESIDSLRAAIEEVRVILTRNGINIHAGQKQTPLHGMSPTKMMIAKQAILNIPQQIDRDAVCEMFDRLYTAAGLIGP